MVNLDGIVVLITGAGTGLGLNTAKGLYQNGAKIACISLEYEVKFPEDCLTFKGDVLDEDFVEDTLERIIKKFGKIDILINNVGFGMNEFCEKLDIIDYEKMFELNLYSQNLLVNKLKNTKLKKVINISSTFAKAALPTLEGYASTKRGALELTREFAKKDDGIMYACILPGYFIHKKHKEYFSRDVGKRFLFTRVPMRRLGIPIKELMPAIYTLCLPAIKNVKYIELTIDGGLSAYDGKD